MDQSDITKIRGYVYKMLALTTAHLSMPSDNHCPLSMPSDNHCPTAAHLSVLCANHCALAAAQ